MPAYVRCKTSGSTFFFNGSCFSKKRLFADPQACDHCNRVEHGKELVGSAHPPWDFSVTLSEAKGLKYSKRRDSSLRSAWPICKRWGFEISCSWNSWNCRESPSLKKLLSVFGFLWSQRKNQRQRPLSRDRKQKTENSSLRLEATCRTAAGP